MVFASDIVPILGGTAAVVGAIATLVGLYLSRRTESESNANQKEAVKAKAKLDEVESLRVVVDTLNGEVQRLTTNLHDANTELDKANQKIDRVNVELSRAQRNVSVLRKSLEANGVPIPFLEPMHDLN